MVASSPFVTDLIQSRDRRKNYQAGTVRTATKVFGATDIRKGLLMVKLLIWSILLEALMVNSFTNVERIW